MLELLKQIRWQDLLDIALLSIIFYKLLLLFKGTKATKMLAGLGILLVASFLSKYLQLRTIDWIISNFWAHVVIVLIILFQPEIRKALVQMGESSFLQGPTSAEELKSLDEIIRTVTALANRKIGALIVVERDMSLKNYVEIGIPLDAKVSRELLLSIFHPTSPIHDGAVLIRGNRVIAAGCFLPIALGADVSKTFGTRHRAGIGITEETDAVAIIVSEETGAISVVIRGKMDAHVNAAALRSMLTNLFAKPKKRIGA